MNRLKLWWASLFIPKNSPYCHHNFKTNKQGFPIVKSCKYWTTKYDKEWKYQREYCKLLKRFLDLDDQIKDCGINDEWGDEE